jgi:hypothetical protein
MNSKPRVPDELIMFDRQFSWRTAWKVGRWWFVAFIISTVCDIIFPQEVRKWPFGWRLAVVFAEFLAILLFVSDAKRFIREMDELQRRITSAALFFSVSASFFFMLLWQRLDAACFFHTLFGPPFMNRTWGIYTVHHACILLGGFYGLGFLIFKRRYK